MKTNLVFWCVSVCVFLVLGCGTPIEEYQAKNEQEKEIQNMLVDFAKARNEYNVNGMAAHLTEDCKVDIVGYSPASSKAQYLSAWKDSDLEYIGKLKFLNLDLDVKDEFAVAKTECSVGIIAQTIPFKFKIIQKDDRWMISEWKVSVQAH